MSIGRYLGNRVVVFATKKPTAQQMLEIEDRLTATGADVLILGTYPTLHHGYIDPLSYRCEYPLSEAFAVAKEAEKRFGRLDRGLGSVAAYYYTRRVEILGGRVVFAGDILLESHNTANITDDLLNCILLDAKQGSVKEIAHSVLRVIKVFQKDPLLGDHSRKKLLAKMPVFLAKALWYLTFGHSFSVKVPAADFKEMRKRGNFVVAPIPATLPLVSVIIRTHARPGVLRATLNCLQYQAYKNVEYIVIEDGFPTAKNMVETEFPHLNICYRATGKCVGRSAAANLGFEMSTGKYINMLDDDDYFYPEHILTGVAVAESKGYDMVFLQSLALLTTIESKDPYEYKVNQVHFMNFPRIDAFTMSQQCMTPNNGVLFSRKLYEKHGGMREDLDAHEDWNLWLRYMTTATWKVVPFATSCFLNPFSMVEREERERKYAIYDGKQFDDETLVYKTTPAILRAYYYGCIEDWHCLLEIGKFEQMLRSEIKKRGLEQKEEKEDSFGTMVDRERHNTQYTAHDFRDLYDSFLAYLYSIPTEKAKTYIVKKYNSKLTQDSKL